MRTAPPLTIEVAQLPGGTGPSEDRVFVTPNAVIVLDGATQMRKLERDGGWIAQELGQRLVDGLTRSPDASLVDLLEQALADLIAQYRLQPRTAPSTTVNIVRCTEAAVDVLVLCDSPVALLCCDGTLDVVRDDRIQTVLESIHRPPGPRNLADPAWRTAVEEFEAKRNSPGGFWVASADSCAAHHALVVSQPLERVAASFSMTDGVAVAVDKYGMPASWYAAISMALGFGAERLLRVVHAIELTDPTCTHWPRTKPHDDKALAIARFK